MQVTLEGGKYRIEVGDGVTTAYRNGEKWQDLTGDNLIYSLVHRINELTDAATAAADQLDTVSDLVNRDGSDAIDWLLNETYVCQELANSLREATESY